MASRVRISCRRQRSSAEASMCVLTIASDPPGTAIDATSAARGSYDPPDRSCGG